MQVVTPSTLHPFTCLYVQFLRLVCSCRLPFSTWLEVAMLSHGPWGSRSSRGLVSASPSLRPPLKGNIVFCLTVRACVIHSCREGDLHSRQPHSRLRHGYSGKGTGWANRGLGAGYGSFLIITLSHYSLYTRLLPLSRATAMMNMKVFFSKMLSFDKKKNIICIHLMPFLSPEKNATSILLSVQWLVMECGSIQSHLGRTFVTNHSVLRQPPAGWALCLRGGKKSYLPRNVSCASSAPRCLSKGEARARKNKKKKLLTVLRGDDAAK